MQSERNVSYQAGLGDFNISELSTPDIYHTSGSTSKAPSDGFVISRDRLGNTVSTYGDDIWDLGSYIYQGASSTKIIFTKLPVQTIDESKWLLFILLFMADSGRSTGLTAGTVISKMHHVIRPLALYSNNNNISIFNMLKTKDHIIRFTCDINIRAKLIGLASLLKYLNTIGKTRTGIEVLRGNIVESISKRAYQCSAGKQHPVIPPRIFKELLFSLKEYTETVFQNINGIESFLHEILNDNTYARCRTKQVMQGVNFRKTKSKRPLFDEAAEQLGIDKIFQKYDVHNIPDLSLFLTRTQHACKLLIHIYTGMRSSEALSLHINCLKYEVNNGKRSYLISGNTRKLIGQDKAESWVSSIDIVNPISVLEKIALIIGRNISLDINEIPLFISPSYLGVLKGVDINNKYITLSKANMKNQEIYNYLDMGKMVIIDSDSKFLDKIDPFRAWESEENYMVGAKWRFTVHQFRRSLAFYVLQSGLVSLPSLKRQLKHITQEMTMYYVQTHDIENIFDSKLHISHTLKKLKPEVDAFAYLHDVLLSDETLYGAGGKYIEKNVQKKNDQVILKEGRKQLEKKFKIGELAYKQTPLGACTSVKPCSEKATRSIVACISCDRSVIKQSKLNRVIDLQKVFVDDLNNNNNNKQSIEYRTEAEDLKNLRELRDKLQSMEVEKK